MSQKFTRSDWLAYEARRSKVAVNSDGVDDESELHRAIMLECHRRGWPVVHSRMDVPATTGVGSPDFVIYADCGRVFTIECKRAKGKLSPAQRALAHWLQTLGHQYHVVTSLQQFMEIVK